MTARVCKALAHPAVTMLGHATGRLLLRREGYKIDLDEVLKAAAEARQDDRDQRPAAPARPRLDPRASGRRRWASRSSSTRTPTAPANWRFYTYGVDVARRGWLTKDDVFNTRSLTDVMKELERRKAARRVSRVRLDGVSRAEARQLAGSSQQELRPHQFGAAARSSTAAFAPPRRTGLDARMPVGLGRGVLDGRTDRLRPLASVLERQRRHPAAPSRISWTAPRGWELAAVRGDQLQLAVHPRTGCRAAGSEVVIEYRCGRSRSSLRAQYADVRIDGSMT